MVVILFKVLLEPHHRGKYRSENCGRAYFSPSSRTHSLSTTRYWISEYHLRPNSWSIFKGTTGILGTLPNSLWLFGENRHIMILCYVPFGDHYMPYTKGVEFIFPWTKYSPFHSFRWPNSGICFFPLCCIFYPVIPVGKYRGLVFQQCILVYRIIFVNVTLFL